MRDLLYVRQICIFAGSMLQHSSNGLVYVRGDHI